MDLQPILKKRPKNDRPRLWQENLTKKETMPSDISLAYERWQLARERFERATDNSLAELLAFDLAAAEMQYIYLLKAQKAKS